MIKKNLVLLFLCFLFAGTVHLKAAIVNAVDGNKGIYTVLPAPTNFHWTGYTAHSISLAWDAVPGATGYVVEAFLGNNPTPITAHYETGTTTTFNNLASDTEYRFEVAAMDGQEKGLTSEVFCQTGIVLDLVADYHPEPPPALQLVSPYSGNNIYHLPWVTGKSYWLKVSVSERHFAQYELVIPAQGQNVHIMKDSETIPSYPYGYVPPNSWTANAALNQDKVRLCYSNFQDYGIGDISIGEQGNSSILELVWAELNWNYTFSVWEAESNEFNGNEDRNSISVPSESTQISPNPFQSTLQITGLNPSVETNLQLFRYDGTLVLSQQSTTVQNYTIDTQNLPSGVYFLRTESEGVRKTYKLMKLN